MFPYSAQPKVSEQLIVFISVSLQYQFILLLMSFFFFFFFWQNQLLTLKVTSLCTLSNFPRITSLNYKILHTIYHMKLIVLHIQSEACICRCRSTSSSPSSTPVVVTRPASASKIPRRRSLSAKSDELDKAVSTKLFYAFGFVFELPFPFPRAFKPHLIPRPQPTDCFLIGLKCRTGRS